MITQPAIPTDYSEEQITAFFRSRLPIINDANKKLPLFLIGVGIEENQPYTDRKCGFLYHQFILVTEGTGIFEYAGTKVTVTTGCCIFIPKQIPHAYYSICEKWTTAWVSFDGTFAEPLLEQFSLTTISVVRSRGISSLFALHQKLLTTASHRYDAERLSVLSYEFLVEYYKQKQHDNADIDIICELEEIKKYLDQNYKQDISLDFLADRFGKSKYKICREYTKYYGSSPNQYQMQLRIQEAKYLLKHTNYNVKEIGNIVGFDDNVYFGKVFKKNESITPKQYREFS